MLLDFLLVPLVYASFASVVALVIAPVQYLKIVRQETASSYTFILVNTLKKRKALKIFFSGALPYVAMNFLSNLSFGLSERVSGILLPLHYNVFAGIFARAILGGVIETVMTVYPEVREIVRNKGDLAFGKGRLSSVLFPSFLRNSVVWLGTTSSYEISVRAGLGIHESVFLSLVLGLVFGIISVPLDVVVTQSCAAEKELTLLKRVMLIASSPGNRFLLGSIIRVFQICVFTAVTVLTMVLLRYFGI